MLHIPRTSGVESSTSKPEMCIIISKGWDEMAAAKLTRTRSEHLFPIKLFSLKIVHEICISYLRFVYILDHFSNNYLFLNQFPNTSQKHLTRFFNWNCFFFLFFTTDKSRKLLNWITYITGKRIHRKIEENYMNI